MVIVEEKNIYYIDQLMLFNKTSMRNSPADVANRAIPGAESAPDGAQVTMKQIVYVTGGRIQPDDGSGWSSQLYQ